MDDPDTLSQNYFEDNADKFLEEFSDVSRTKVEEYKNRKRLHLQLSKLSFIAAVFSSILLAITIYFNYFNQTIAYFVILLFLIFNTALYMPRWLNHRSPISDSEVFILHLSRSISNYNNGRLEPCRNELEHIAGYGTGDVPWLSSKYQRLVEKYASKVTNAENHTCSIQENYEDIIGGAIHRWELEQLDEKYSQIENIPVDDVEVRPLHLQFIHDSKVVLKELMMNKIFIIIISMTVGVAVYYATDELAVAAAAPSIVLAIYIVFSR